MQSIHRMARGQGEACDSRTRQLKVRLSFKRTINMCSLLEAGETKRTSVKDLLNKEPILERKSMKGKKKKNTFESFFVKVL